MLEASQAVAGEVAGCVKPVANLGAGAGEGVQSRADAFVSLS